MKKILPFAVAALFSLNAFAASQTITLAVPTMNCASCPITVKKALKRVEGVMSAKVAYNSKLAVVTFDDNKTTAKALMAATGNAGYPSTVAELNANE